MELSAGSAFFAALIVLFGGLGIACWIADIIQKWYDKRHPRPKKKPLSFNDPRFRR
jgi:hypothetical protein